MTGQDIQLLIITTGSILLLVVLVASRLRFHPFIALLTTSILVGLAAGMDIKEMVGSLESGAGSILGNIGITIALGAMFGRLLADSGASECIASAILGNTSKTKILWLIPVIAFIIGLPMFFEVGLIILLPIIVMAARTGRKQGASYIFVVTPVLAALSTLNGMVPPHPVPLLAVTEFDASLGKTMLLGVIGAIPAIIIAGPLYTKVLTSFRNRHDQETSAGTEEIIEEEASEKRDVSPSSVSLPVALMIVLLPMLIMITSALVDYFLPKESLGSHIAQFVGAPPVALLIGLLTAVIVLGYAQGMEGTVIRDSLDESLKSIAGILLIIAGGGAFGEVLQDAHVGGAIIHLAESFSFPPIILGWVVSALLAIATGSTTVGVVGATGILKPLVLGDASMDTSLIVMAIGSGSLFFNFINHGSFWLVNKSFDLTIKETVQIHTVTRSIISVVGLGMILLLDAIVG